MEQETVSLVKHSKHVPRILRQQILCHLINNYVHDRDESAGPKISPPSGASRLPSIQRFYGALLFVDISGFTALSLKLDVETLKNYINEYFTKMLDIVDKWDGDVVKFAGDALYIVWPTKHQGRNSDSDNESPTAEHESYHFAAKRATEMAVACASEIRAACSDYEVRVEDHAAPCNSPGILSKLMSSFSFGGFLGGKAPSSQLEDGEDGTLYLNVHSGISYGLMAGIDLVYNDRAEYFLCGEPLTGVAMAESQASVGDVVLCTNAHELLHADGIGMLLRHQGINKVASRNSSFRSKKGSVKLDYVLPCGCYRTGSGLYKIAKTPPPNSCNKEDAAVAKKRARFHAKLGTEKSSGSCLQSPNRSGAFELNTRISDAIESDLEYLFDALKDTIKEQFFSFFRTLRELAEKEELLDDRNSSLCAASADEEKFSIFMKDILKKHFFEWMTCSLLSHVNQHVHEALRYTGTKDRGLSNKRMSSWQEMLRASASAISSSKDLDSSSLDWLNSLDMWNPTSSVSQDHDISPFILSSSVDSMSKHSHDKHSIAVVPLSNCPGNVREIEELDMLAPFQEKAKKSLSKGSLSAELNSAELRTVIVMFVKIERFDLHLKTDAKLRRIDSAANRFSFLDRTESEQEADAMLLNRFQACFEVLCKSLSDQGGQLRQFIVDDKGTVCIGTFGLRGSAAVDNAAAALESAKLIVEGLKSLDLKASIGITSGKAYCGLVGSFLRHEYAVMGPSTNLSARLMCKAPAHGIICDADTVSRDRTHKFVFLSEIQAKGYSTMVRTYSPCLGEDELDDSFGKMSTSVTTKHALKKRGFTRLSLQIAAQEVNDLFTNAMLASESKLAAHQRMLSLVKTGFFISEATVKFDAEGNQKNVTSLKLLGRDKEITQIFSFLFENDAEDPQLLRIDGEVKMVIISSPSGIGKTALLNAIERKLQNVIRTDHACNAVVLRNRSSSLHLDLPFRAWQAVIQKLLLSAFKSVCVTKAVNETISNNNSPATTDGLSVGVSTTRMMSLVDIVWTNIPQELQAKRHLLTLITSAQSEDQWNQIDPKEKTDEQLEECALLIAALFTVVASISKTLSFVIIEDVQALDKWSLRALHTVWSQSKGVVILADYDTTESMTLATKSEDLAGNKTNTAFSFSLPGVPEDVARCFANFSDNRRVNILPLQPLSKDAVKAMVTQSCPNLKDDELETVYIASGGNPLYVVELLDSIDRFNLEFKNNSLVKLDSSALAEVIPSANSITNRIEEVICYRLDKLHCSSQVLLKAVAVAVSYGHGCSLAMLKYILADHDLVGCDSTTSSPGSSFISKQPSRLGRDIQPNKLVRLHNVRDSLLQMLRKQEFLTPRGTHSSKKPKDITHDDLRALEFQFLVPLEQNTIYSLIIEEQKEYFHERVAMFLQMKHPDNADIQDLWEEGFHWDRAGYWSRALRAYLMAAKKCKQEGQSLRCAESAFMAYQIYQNIEQEVAIVTFPEQCYSFADRMARCLFQPTEDNLKVLETNADLIIALKTAQEVFEPDPPSIVDAIELHILLAEVYLYRWEDFGEVMRLLSVAILLAVASIWVPSHELKLAIYFQLDSSHTSKSLLRRGSKFAVSETSSTSNSAADPLINFPRHNLSLDDIIRVLSLTAYVSLFLRKNEGFILSSDYSKGLLQESHGTSQNADSSSELSAIHIQAVMALRYLQAGKYSRAVSLLDQALQEYCPAEHSQALISRYSADFVPYAVALLSQALMSGCDLSAGLNYWQRALTCLQSVSHYYSRFITITVLMSTVHFVGDYRGLLALLEEPPPATSGLGDTLVNTSCFLDIEVAKLWLRVKIQVNDDSLLTSLSEDEVEQFLQLCRSIDDAMAVTCGNSFRERSSSLTVPLSAPQSPLLPVRSFHLANATTATPIVSHEFDIPLNKLDFMEHHGCALERLYIEIACSLWPKANKSQLYALEERIQSSLHILLQSPIYDTTSVLAKGYNMLHSLSPILQTSESENGLSAGAIYVAVTERAEQPLLTLLNQLVEKEFVYMAWLNGSAIRSLPLHESIQDSYASVCEGTRSRVMATYCESFIQDCLLPLGKKLLESIEDTLSLS
eukprot:gene8132-8972_t